MGNLYLPKDRVNVKFRVLDFSCYYFPYTNDIYKFWFLATFLYPCYLRSKFQGQGG